MSPAEKAQTTAIARAALAGIVAVPSRDGYGYRTVILSRGCWTRECRPEQVGEALTELRLLETAEADA